MGKSSSSRKKKRSKASSSQRSRRKSRNRKLKSKKLRHRHDSSSYSDIDLESSTSVSSSSSEDDKEVGRSRSGTRKDAKPSKKRAQKRSHDRQTRDSSPRPRKRKHSKRAYDRAVKKTYKKKRRRDVSVSATSSGSMSCSTCREGSASGSGNDRHRGRSRKRKRNLGKTERSRYRSKSHSSCSICSKGSDYQIEVGDGGFVANNSRRLRSIIVVAGEEYKPKNFNADEEQEVITYHSDDDQSSFRNIDGNDVAGKRELYHVSSREVAKVVNEKEVVGPDIRNFVDVKDHEVQNDGSSDNHGGFTNDHSLNETKNDCSGNTDHINSVDLESILRQRALENLRKFKRVSKNNVETPANLKLDNNNDPKQLNPLVSKSIHAKLPRDNVEVNGVEFLRQDGGNKLNSMMVAENGAKSTVAIDLAVANTHDVDHPSQSLKKISDGSNINTELKQDRISLDEEVTNDDIGQKAGAVTCCTTNRSHLIIAALTPQSKIDSHKKKASALQESIQREPSISDVGVDETAQNLTEIMNNDDQNTGNGFGSSAPKTSSSLKLISGENSLNKSGHDREEGSQFEQKTMSVMRGGEMVQVNYKVYIPKRAPALSRRQLKR